MSVLRKRLFRHIYRIVVSKRLHTILSFIYSLAIEELTVGGTAIRPSKHAKNNKYTILILSSKAFRKDIDCLVATNEFRVLRLPGHWQSRLIYQFYPEEFQKFWYDTNPDHPDYKYRRVATNPDHPNYKYKKNQKEIREFLYRFLARLYKRISVNCVISPHPRYVVDMDWGAISTQLGVPHILIPRDSQLASSPCLLDYSMHLFKNGLPKFEGEHIIIQSELDKQVYTDTGYVKPEKISSLGCPRMDDFINKTKEKGYVTEKRRKKIVFLSFMNFRFFNPEKGNFEISELLPYVKELHLFFVQFAIQHPEIDVVMKHKPKGFHRWKEKVLYEAIKGFNIDINRIPNLIVRDGIDIHSLFIESEVVCGLNTSAILEAAVIGLPIIIPYFKDLQNTKYEERVFYRDAYDLFDIAKDVNELESIIIDRLHNPTIDEEIMEERKALFEKYVSSMKGDATEKYVALIRQVVAEGGGKRVY